MNIKILDSWLREYLDTKAKAKDIAEKLSLTSVSVDRVEPFNKNDFIYDIEITTNRVDLMSVEGLAREAAAILPQFQIDAKFIPNKVKRPQKIQNKHKIEIENNPEIVNRVCAVVMDVRVKESPLLIKERLETSGIRSLNNIIDVTNYIMRETGHPTHVFDFDRLNTDKLIIRESKKGEKITTLDLKEYELKGGDIVAEDSNGRIVDLLGIMGLENSVVNDRTKRILFFIDNTEPHHIRRTSMALSIHSEASSINEKGVDPQRVEEALFRGIELYEKIADGKIVSEIIDIYPNKPKKKRITITDQKVNKIIGIELRSNEITNLLSKLGFEAKRVNDKIEATIPTYRLNDIEIEEDLVEEVARVYGYQKLPSVLPPLYDAEDYHIEKDEFYWEDRVKKALKYWGFTETYTYSLVSENLLEGPIDEAQIISNPLTEDMVYLRNNLVPSLLEVVKENESQNIIKIFELSNVYIPVKNDLPHETLHLAGVVKKENISFFEIKGIIEALMQDLGINKLIFKNRESGGYGAEIFLDNKFLGEIEFLDDTLCDFEFNFELVKQYANLKKTFNPIAKFPPVIEDVRITIAPEIQFERVITEIKKQSDLIVDVSLLDVYENKKTFRIKYQHPGKTLTTEEISKIRQKIYEMLEKDLKAKIT